MGWFRLSRGGSRPDGVIRGLIGFFQACWGGSRLDGFFRGLMG